MNSTPPSPPDAEPLADAVYRSRLSSGTPLARGLRGRALLLSLSAYGLAALLLLPLLRARQEAVLRRTVQVALTEVYDTELAPPPPPGGGGGRAPEEAAPEAIPETPSELPQVPQQAPEPVALAPLAPASPATPGPAGEAQGVIGGVAGGHEGGAVGGSPEGVAGGVQPPRFDAAYLKNPEPIYPPLSQRLGEEGRVLLRVLVDAEGRAERVELKSGSGHPRLDQAALDTVRRWRFTPARRGADPVAAWVLVPLTFHLDA